MKTIDRLRMTDRLRVTGAGLSLACGMVALGIAGFWSNPPCTARVEGFDARLRVRPSKTLLAAARPRANHSTGKVHFDLLAKLLADDRRSVLADEWLRQLADPKPSFRVETQDHPRLGRVAPDFTLTNYDGQPWNLREHLTQRPVVLVFYLGYSCNACVHHLCELNADLERFRALGAEVVAVSDDPPEETRQQFQRYGGFGFAVLSDPGHVAAEAYGTFHPASGAQPERLLHGTFLVGRDGLINWAHCGDAPFRGNMALLYELANESRP